MNPIEKAYKAWRATVTPLTVSYKYDHRAIIEKPRKYAGTGRYKRTAAHREANRRGALRRWGHAVDVPLTPSERARHAVASFWATLTPEQRSERQRKAAKKMWKRRKAEEYARLEPLGKLAREAGSR